MNSLESSMHMQMRGTVRHLCLWKGNTISMHCSSIYPANIGMTFIWTELGMRNTA